jgi:hypothetical protein
MAPVDQYMVPRPVYTFEAPDPSLNRTRSSDHRVYEHNNPAFASEGGQAYLASSCQELEDWLHDLKHDELPDGIERFPITEEGFFMPTLLQGSGYLGTHAIDLRIPGKPDLVPISRRVRGMLSTSTRLHLEQEYDVRAGKLTTHAAEDKIGRYFAHFAISRLSQVELERILNASRAEHPRMARKGLGAGIIRAVAPVQEEFARLAATRQIRNGRERPTAQAAVLRFVELLQAPRYFASYVGVESATGEQEEQAA